VFWRFFLQHKTNKKIYNTHKHKTNKIRFVQYSAIRCCAFFSHSEKVHKKHSQNTPKKSQNTRKTPQNTGFIKTLAKTPQNIRKTHTRKTPQKHIC